MVQRPPPDRVSRPLRRARAVGRVRALSPRLPRGAKAAAQAEAVRRVIASGSATAVFQPIWSPTLAGIRGWEALARFPAAPELGGPQQAFDLAERLGLAHELDAGVRDAVVAAAPDLPPDALLFLNLAPGGLVHDGFSPGDLLVQLRPAGIGPERVVCEITERTSVAVEPLGRRVEELRALGFRVALDDVGAGNAGLEWLRHLAVDFVKVDRAVLTAAMDSPAGRGIFAAILSFAHQAGAAVVAEGIETHEMLAAVCSRRLIDTHPEADPLWGLQGYALGRPKPLQQSMRLVG